MLITEMSVVLLGAEHGDVGLAWGEGHRMSLGILFCGRL